MALVKGRSLKNFLYITIVIQRTSIRHLNLWLWRKTMVLFVNMSYIQMGSFYNWHPVSQKIPHKMSIQCVWKKSPSVFINLYWTLFFGNFFCNWEKFDKVFLTPRLQLRYTPVHPGTTKENFVLKMTYKENFAQKIDLN